MRAGRTSLACLITLAAFGMGCGSGSRPPQTQAPPPAAASTHATTGAAPAPATRLRLALNWVPEPEFGGFYAARATGETTKRGLDLEIQDGGAGLPTVQMVATDKVELGIAGADEVVISRARGTDVVALFAVYQHCPQGIMSHASQGFAKLADVFSHPGTVLLEPGAPFARWLDRTYGFSKVTIAPYAGGVTQFLADEKVSQQCYVTSEPLAARAHHADVRTFLVADSGYDPYATVVVARQAWLDAHADVARAFLDAARAGWAAYLADPTAANAEMGAANAAMDAATFAAVATAQKPLIETDDTKAHGLGVMSVARFKSLGDQLVLLEVINHPPDPASCLSTLAAPATPPGATPSPASAPSPASTHT